VIQEPFGKDRQKRISKRLVTDHSLRWIPLLDRLGEPRKERGMLSSVSWLLFTALKQKSSQPFAAWYSATVGAPISESLPAGGERAWPCQAK
jgi:hypothetical protein